MERQNLITFSYKDKNYKKYLDRQIFSGDTGKLVTRKLVTNSLQNSFSGMHKGIEYLGITEYPETEKEVTFLSFWPGSSPRI